MTSGSRFEGIVKGPKEHLGKEHPERRNRKCKDPEAGGGRRGLEWSDGVDGQQGMGQTAQGSQNPWGLVGHHRDCGFARAAGGLRLEEGQGLSWVLIGFLRLLGEE